MERDFMGLTVKQEILEEPATDPSAVARSLAMQWSFSNKTYPQHLSFKGTTPQENNNKPKTGFESLASVGLVTITTTTEPVDAIHRPYSTGVTQKNTMPEMRSRTNYTMTTSYPPHQIGAQYSVANQTHHQAKLISTVNQNSARGAHITSPNSTPVPTRNGVVGTTELRGAPRTSSGPAKLTIFYAGSVCVYDNISPEKAQAIMLLAGNAPPVTPSTTSTASPVQTIPKSPYLDSFVNVNKYSRSPIFSSPVTISRGRSTGVLKSPSNTAEPSKIVGSQESRPPSHNLSAVPQARKASLARFLEKRKERVVSASPYGNSKGTSQYIITPASGNWSFSVNSSGSTPLPATN